MRGVRQESEMLTLEVYISRGKITFNKTFERIKYPFAIAKETLSAGGSQIIDLALEVLDRCKIAFALIAPNTYYNFAPGRVPKQSFITMDWDMWELEKDEEEKGIRWEYLDVIDDRWTVVVLPRSWGSARLQEPELSRILSREKCRRIRRLTGELSQRSILPSDVAAALHLYVEGVESDPPADAVLLHQSMEAVKEYFQCSWQDMHRMLGLDKTYQYPYPTLIYRGPQAHYRPRHAGLTRVKAIKYCQKVLGMLLKHQGILVS